MVRHEFGELVTFVSRRRFISAIITSATLVAVVTSSAIAYQLGGQLVGTNKRIRGYPLQQIRKRWFRLHPLCVECEKEGRVELATELDHIVPICKGGADTDDNRQGLCKRHHDMKTALDGGYEYREPRRIGLDGFPIEEHRIAGEVDSHSDYDLVNKKN